MSEYPFTYSDGRFPLMDDNDLERLVSEKCGDEVGQLLHRRLYGNCDQTTFDELLRHLSNAKSDADSLSDSLYDLLEYFGKLKNRLPAGGVIGP